jgi:peptidoglycan/xylan/chitin deacetylase (PgdA/CDA1 family)
MDVKGRDAIIDELVKKTGPLAVQQRSNYELMGWNEIIELQSQGVSFGVHTHSHPHLTRRGVDLRVEIDDAAALISKRLSVPLADLLFCYPDGDYDKAIRDRVEASGMFGAAAVKNELAPPDADAFALPRVAVAGQFSQAMFYDATVGFTRLLKRFYPFGR